MVISARINRALFKIGLDFILPGSSSFPNFFITYFCQIDNESTCSFGKNIDSRGLKLLYLI